MGIHAEFKKNGYVLIKNFFSQAEVDVLVADIKEASSTKAGNDVLDKGHLKFHALIMHRSEKLRAFISQTKIIDFLKQFAGPDIWVRWDQAVEKKPGAGTFPWHQDNQYSQLKDAHFQFWISLTTMTAENSRWAYVVEYMQMDHMDPFIDAPYLVVAKNGQPDLHYLNRLPAQDDWINRWKYWDAKQKVKKQMKSILTIVKSTVVKNTVS